MELPTIFQRVVGLDIHQAQVTACAVITHPDGTTATEHRQFGTFKRDRRALAEWVAAFEPDQVVMESTGIYWKAPYAALERAGIRALVVNARHVKQVPGRKTDIGDAQWLALLVRAGLLRGSFIPPARLRELRLVGRQRVKLVRMLAAEKNRLHKGLTDAGIRLGVVVSDVHGKTARVMTEALLEGQTPEQVLALAGRRLKATRAQLFEALQGDLSPAHAFMLSETLAHIKALEARIARFDEFLLAGLAEESAILALLQTLPGVDRIGAALLIVEIGTDMEAFGRVDRLASWVGVCPGNNESAGKRKSGRTRKGNPYVRRLLCEFAQAASRTQSVFQSKFESLKFRRGHKRAIIAIAHKLLRTIFYMIKRRTPYQDSSVDYQQLSVKRNAPRWIRMMKKYGYLTTPA
ncbi:MAG: IS110 family transposase [Salinisphaera sp.]|jgi:transposase|nr:IS110 family transposase [Salinisphaera sp.]